MFFNTLGRCLLAGGLLLSLSSFFATQSAIAQDATQVLTPLGYRDKANVHKVPQGYDLMVMPDRHVRMRNRTTGHYIDFPKPISTQTVKPSFTDKGWVTFASWLNQWGLPITYFGTDWIVPPAPATYDGQTIFQFNGIQPLDSTAILQPVLQYGPSAAGGGKYWQIASWYVTDSQAYFSDTIYVKPGQFLGGMISLTGRKRSAFSYSYTCQFYGFPQTLISVQGVEQLVWCAESLEVYGVDNCSEFPNTPYSQMNAISIRLKGGITPYMGWTITNAQTACNAQTTVVVNGANNAAVNIYY